MVIAIRHPACILNDGWIIKSEDSSFTPVLQTGGLRNAHHLKEPVTMKPRI